MGEYVNTTTFNVVAGPTAIAMIILTWISLHGHFFKGGAPVG